MVRSIVGSYWNWSWKEEEMGDNDDPNPINWIRCIALTLAINLSGGQINISIALLLSSSIHTTFLRIPHTKAQWNTTSFTHPPLVKYRENNQTSGKVNKCILSTGPPQLLLFSMELYGKTSATWSIGSHQRNNKNWPDLISVSRFVYLIRLDRD